MHPQQTHLYLQSQNQMYLEGVLRWQKCGEGHLITIFINFQRMAMQFERILSLRREPPSS